MKKIKIGSLVKHGSPLPDGRCRYGIVIKKKRTVRVGYTLKVRWVNGYEDWYTPSGIEVAAAA